MDIGLYIFIPLHILRKAFSLESRLNGAADDVDNPNDEKRLNDQNVRSVILVGHFYGGVVITEAANDSKVTGLVFVAAFAPDAGQSIVEISKRLPEANWFGQGSSAAGWVSVALRRWRCDWLSQDPSKEEQALITSDQPQTHGSIVVAQPA